MLNKIKCLLGFHDLVVRKISYQLNTYIHTGCTHCRNYYHITKNYKEVE